MFIDMLAMAGGGSSYSGGGGFSGGGSGFGGGYSGGGISFRSSGGGDGELSGWGVVIAIVIIIIVTVAQKYGKQWQQNRPRNVIQRGVSARDRISADRVVTRLQHIDSAFDAAAFERRIRAAFHKIQQHWCQQSLQPVMSWLSDGVAERWQVLLDEQRQRGERDDIEALHIDAVKFVDLESDKNFDALTVMITGQVKERKVGGSARVFSRMQPFKEYWTLLRRSGVQSRREPGTMEGSCPNCGGGLGNLNQSGHCPNCGAAVRSGDFDWVLVGITQASEYQSSGGRVMPGVAELQQDDPGFNVYQITDRAAVAFYRYHQARRQENPDLLASIAMPDAMHMLVADQADILANCAIGSVQLHGVVHDHRGDRCMVEVRYSGQRQHRGADGRPLLGEATAPRKCYYVMFRPSGVKTEISTSFNASHCPACGAPEVQSTTCAYCGATLGAGSDEWLLDQVLPWSSQAAHELLAQMRGSAVQPPTQGRSAIGGLLGGTNGITGQNKFSSSTTDTAAADHDLLQQSAASVMAWAITTALADQRIDPQEEASIDAMGRHLGLHPSQISGMIREAQRGELVAPEPQTKEQAAAWLRSLAVIVWSDGLASQEERQVLHRMGQKFGYARYDVNKFLQQARDAAIQEAQAAIAESQSHNKGF